MTITTPNTTPSPIIAALWLLFDDVAGDVALWSQEAVVAPVPVGELDVDDAVRSFTPTEGAIVTRCAVALEASQSVVPGVPHHHCCGPSDEPVPAQGQG